VNKFVETLSCEWVYKTNRLLNRIAAAYSMLAHSLSKSSQPMKEESSTNWPLVDHFNNRLNWKDDFKLISLTVNSIELSDFMLMIPHCIVYLCVCDVDGAEEKGQWVQSSEGQRRGRTSAGGDGTVKGRSWGETPRVRGAYCKIQTQSEIVCQWQWYNSSSSNMCVVCWLVTFCL